MKTFALACVTLACIGSVALGDTPATDTPRIGDHVPEFMTERTTLSGSQPQTTAFDSGKVKRVTTYIFVGSTCPATNAYADRFKELERTYGPKGVDFVYLYPNGNDTHDVQLGFHREKGFTGALIDDHGARLAGLFKAKRTTEIFVVDTHGTIVFHGAVDDSREPRAITKRYLAPALDEILAGKPVTTPTSDVFA